jgi:hypothetical protein
MATFRQAGESAAKEGMPAERAVVEYFRSDVSASELHNGLEQFLDGFGVRTNPARATLFERCVKAVTSRRKIGRKGTAKRAAAGRAKGGRPSRKNPADTAAAAYQEFHGHPPKLTVEVKRRVHSHRHLVGAGVLKAMDVAGIDGKRHTISGFRGALLAFAESGNQLFIEGGDQTVNLEDYGIDRPHETETLGRVLSISYHTDKSHLGAEGGNAVYKHGFRTTNEDGRHVVVKVKRYPDLIYRVLEQQLEFSGGSYEIRREGIDY